MNKRVLFAMVLSLAVIFLFQMKQAERLRKFEEEQRKLESATGYEEPVTPPAKAVEPATAEVAAATPAKRETQPFDLGTALAAIVRATGQPKEITFDSTVCRYVFSTQGGAFRSIRLLDYEENEGTAEFWEYELKYAPNNEVRTSLAEKIARIKKRNADIEDLDRRIEEAETSGLDDSPLVYERKVEAGVELIAENGLEAPTLKIGRLPVDEDLVYRCDSSGGVLKNATQTVSFTATVGALEIKKTYTLHRDIYDVDLLIEVTKTADAPAAVTQDEDYELWWMPVFGYDASSLRGQKEIAYQIGDKIVAGRSFLKKLGNGISPEQPNVRWAARQRSYFIAAMIPQRVDAYPVDGPPADTKLGMRLDPGPIQPGKSLRYDVRVYAGPVTLEGLRSQKVGLEDLAFGGWTGGLSRGVLGILRWTRNHLTFNYGLSIILITVLLRVLTHPLNKKQMQSTEKMKMLQPMVENLKAKHKDDPQKLQQETWKLYKQHKVNPLGGCLPLLLTMPIFIALWTCFRNAIELRGESFLWIGDLSRPDTLLSIPLPFVIPLIGQGHHLPINLLPLIYGVVSILQQKRMATSPSASPMMKYLPVMFIFIFYSFPAGVMLYLFFSNLLMVGSQIFHEKYGKKTAIQEVDNERSRRNGKDKRRGHTKGPRKATNNPR